MPRLQLPSYPAAEFMTVSQAAEFFHVNETGLLNLILWIQLPVLGKDDWGRDLYSRESIRQQLGR